ncbi:MAG: SLBB domain-containing protein, partial [Flavobacterium sp.]|nr:SLBB domain-containing protein [Flavobacterium sp.]
SVAGLTRIEAQNKIQSILREHIADARVDIRIQNFKITVLGEVMRPGTINVSSERITILEALGMVGDLGIQGKRDNILLIREQDGQSITQRLDLRDPNLIQSPYYYLVQNDVIYVEPNKTKINSSGVGPNLTVGLTALSLLIGIISLTIR